MKYTRNLKESHCVIKKPLLLIGTYLKRLALRNEFGKWVKKRCTQVFGQSSDNRWKTSKNKLIFFHTQSAEGCLKEEIDILNIFCWIRKILQMPYSFIFDSQWTLNGKRWEELWPFTRGSLTPKLCRKINWRRKGYRTSGDRSSAWKRTWSWDGGQSRRCWWFNRNWASYFWILLKPEVFAEWVK